MAKISIKTTPTVHLELTLEEAANVAAVLGKVKVLSKTYHIYSDLCDLVEQNGMVVPTMKGLVEFND
jgi:hypothetical protein